MFWEKVSPVLHYGRAAEIIAEETSQVLFCE